MWPNNNAEFWKEKILNNIQRDERNKSLSLKQGWNMVAVWECELKKTMREQRLSMLCNEIRSSSQFDKEWE